MLIYCNGDSFTAGVSAADHVFPGFLGGFTDSEVKAQSPAIKEFIKTKEAYCKTKYFSYDDALKRQGQIEFSDHAKQGYVDLAHNFNIFEKNYSFPAELELLDSSIKTINAAKPGASMGGIARRTVLDLLNYQAQGTKIDLVVIQVTSHYRYEIFDCRHGYLLNDRPFASFDNTAEKRISEAVVLKYDDNDLTVKFLYDLSMIKNIALSMTGKMPLIIDSINGENIDMRIKTAADHISIVNPSCSSTFNNLIEHSGIKQAHMRFMLEQANKLDLPYAYDGHFLNEVYRLTAQELIKLL